MVEQVRSGTSEVDDLGAAMAVLLQARTFEAVEGIGNDFTTADDTLVLVVSKGTLVAYAD